MHNKVTKIGRSKPHVIYRRSTTLDDRQKLHTARGKRQVHTCGTEGKYARFNFTLVLRQNTR